MVLYNHNKPVLFVQIVLIVSIEQMLYKHYLLNEY
jgi:hypothetical protein